MKLRVRELFAVLATAFIILTVGLLGSLAFEQRSAQVAEGWTRHSYDVLTQSETLLRRVAVDESAVRGSVLNGSPRSLATYEASASAVPDLARALRRSVADNSRQSALAEVLATRIGERLASLRQIADLVRTGRHEAARVAASAPQDETLMQRVRMAAEQFEDEELSLRYARAARAREENGALLRTLIFGAFAALAAILAAGTLVSRSIVGRLGHLVEKSTAIARGRTVAVPSSGRDEISDLDRALCGMATTLKERGEALERYRLLSDRAHDTMLFVRRRDGRILDCNASACTTYGYTREQLVGSSVYALGGVSPVDTDRSSSMISVRRRADGTPILLEISAQGSTIAEEEIVLEIARDVTEGERVKVELASARDAAMEASRLKSEFVATMSHEIRTPMNGVIGMSELLLLTPLDTEQRDFALTISESGQALLGIINDILDFSKIEAGALRFEEIDFAPRRIVESVAELFAIQARARGVRIMTYLAPEVPRALRGDPGRLRQILVNLVGNAVKFTERGSVTVTVECDDSDADAAVLRFAVRDTGIGLSKKAHRRLFAAFEQADASTTRRYGGTGLGLTITKRLVEAMGGSITVESEEGRGSLFCFDSRFGRSHTMLDEPLDTMTLAGRRTILVGSKTAACDLIARHVRAWGMECVLFSGAAEAAAAIRGSHGLHRPFELAFLEECAEETVGETQARAALSRSLRIIGFGIRNDVPDARSGTHGDGRLLLPVRESQLFNTIVSALDRGHDAPSSSIAPEQGAASTAPQPRVGRGPILVAEDNAVNQRLVVRQLNKLSCFDIDVVANGREALGAVDARSYSLVIMDCQMPEMDGFQAVTAIRLRDDAAGRVPIIALTANAQESDRDACLAVGMNDYLSKPVQLAQLQSILDRWLPSYTHTLGAP